MSQLIAVIDIGSNSIRLVVFDGLARAPHYVFNEKVMCGLGLDFEETGALSVNGVERARASMLRFKLLMQAMKVAEVRILATAAVREASDGADFAQMISRIMGIEVEILAGVDEARVSAQGVLLGWPGANGVVCDIGGSSMELALLSRGEISDCITTPLGPLRLDGIKDEEMRKYRIKTVLAKVPQTLADAQTALYLVGGSWRAMAKLDMVRRGYPLPILHEYTMSPDDVRETTRWVQKTPLEELAMTSEVSLSRLVLAQKTASVLRAVVKRLNPKQVVISSYGLREGVLWEAMPAEMRAEDPLISASRKLELTSARFPGFGDRLFAWSDPIFLDETAEWRRLRHAACLLHDTNWKIHPDARAQVAFDTITRANFCGVTHAEKLFLGLSMETRYKASPVHSLAHPALGLVMPEAAERAIVLGRALRLGAMMTGATSSLLDRTRLVIRDSVLILEVDKYSRELIAESVDKRLRSLAEALGLSAKIVVEQTIGDRTST